MTMTAVAVQRPGPDDVSVVSSGKARVYLIANPALRKSRAWEKLRPVIRKRAKNAELVTYDDVFAGKDDYAASWQERLLALAGAVVVANRYRGSLWLGEHAVREAACLADAGKPVLMFGPFGLVPWGGVRLDRPEDHPTFTPVQVCIGPGPDDRGVRGDQAGSLAGGTGA